jgi:hypothetical protein
MKQAVTACSFDRIRNPTQTVAQKKAAQCAAFFLCQQNF